MENPLTLAFSMINKLKQKNYKMKKIYVLFIAIALASSNDVLFAQDIGIVYDLGGTRWTGVTYNGLFYLEASNGASCTYRYNIEQLQNGLYCIKIFNPSLYGWYPASFVLYPNGTTQGTVNGATFYGMWKFIQEAKSKNPSFGDSYCSKYRGKKCSEQGPYDIQPCKCSGFSCSNRDASVCTKCGHHATKHNR